MSKKYIEAEVDKIINDKSLEYPQNLAMASAWIIGNFKGLNLKVVDVRGQSSLADFFVIGSSTNTTQAKAIADEITNQTKRLDYVPKSKEGFSDADWILIDLGDIIIHLFQENSRDIYNLDELWKDSKQIDIPQSYYFSESELDQSEDKESESDKSYF